jgi:hypothetical protein
MQWKTNHSISTDQWIINLILVILLLIFFFSSLCINPQKTPLLSCFFHEKTGFSCPTCGISRSFYSFSRLNISESFHYHWMGPIMYILLLILLLKLTIEIATKRNVQLIIKPIIKKIFVFLFLFLWLIFCLIRFSNEYQGAIG